MDDIFKSLHLFKSCIRNSYLAAYVEIALNSLVQVGCLLSHAFYSLCVIVCWQPIKYRRKFNSYTIESIVRRFLVNFS